MAAQLPPEDQPPLAWRRFATDEEVREVSPAPDLTSPESVGFLFFQALEQPDHYFNALQNLTTPESWDDWGDFSEARDAVASMPNCGYSNRCARAVDADDVAYFKVFSDVPQSYEVVDSQILTIAGVLSMVWRPELDSWRIHSFGGYLRPEELPRTADL